jgi:hypothetical protein
VAKLENLKSLFPVEVNEQTPVNASNHLIEVHPCQDENGKIDRSEFCGKILSRHILEILLRKKEALIVMEFRDIFNMLFDLPSTRSAAGIVFEEQGHHYLRKQLRKEIIYIRPLSNSPTPHQRVALNLRHVNRATRFSE